MPKLYITPTDSKMSEVYHQYKDPDGFLYIEYCEYNSFGADI
jgi:Microtubule associated protein 1A/1B, light chain 3.